METLWTIFKYQFAYNLLLTSKKKKISKITFHPNKCCKSPALTAQPGV